MKLLKRASARVGTGLLLVLFFLARLLIKHQTHAKAQLDTRVPWQEVTHKAPLPDMPASPECDLYRNRESVYVWLTQSVCTCLWGAVETSQKGGGPCSRPGSSSSLAGHCQEATSSTHHWPGSPCPGWLQGRGSSGWPHRASWGGRWQLSWPGQSPGSLEYSQTWPRCYSALGPRWRTVKNSESHKLFFFFLTNLLLITGLKTDLMVGGFCFAPTNF